MDYEKAYKEALKRAKGIHTFSSDIAEIKRMEQIFPELTERKDERIRKAQLDYWRSVGGKEWHGVPVQEVIAWLEKQEDKPKWTEEDDYNVQCCIAKVKNDIANVYPGTNKELIEWLISLKQRMEEQQ